MQKNFWETVLSNELKISYLWVEKKQENFKILVKYSHKTLKHINAKILDIHMNLHYFTHRWCWASHHLQYILKNV